MASKLIGGFKASTETLDGRVQCWITKDGHCSSLAAVEQTGEIEHPSRNTTVKVPASTVDKIADWALEQGY